MTSVSARLHDAAAPVWEACLRHPFVTGIGDGTLDMEKFRYFMLQDYLYLFDYARVFALGVVKDELLGMLLAGDDEREGIMAGIVEELRRCLVPVRRERSYPRDGVEGRYANRYSNTHKRVF